MSQPTKPSPMGVTLHGANMSQQVRLDRTASVIESENLQRELNDVVHKIESTVRQSKTSKSSTSPIHEKNTSEVESRQTEEELEQEAYQICQSVEKIVFLSQFESHGTCTDPNPLSENQNSASKDECVTLTRKENMRLMIRVQQLETALSKVKSTAQGFKEERDRIKRKVRSGRVAEHLVGDVYHDSSIQESLCQLGVTDKSKQLELELEKVRAQSGNMQSQVGLLEQSLNESRSCSDYLSGLCAQLEANQTALHLAIGYSNLAEELIDCVLHLSVSDSCGNDNRHSTVTPTSHTHPKNKEDGGGSESEQEKEALCKHWERRSHLLMEKVESHLSEGVDESFPLIQGHTSDVHNKQVLAAFEEGMTSSGALTASTTGSGESSSCEELIRGDLWASVHDSGRERKRLNCKLEEQILRLKSAKMSVLDTILPLDSVYSEPPALFSVPGFALPNNRFSPHIHQNIRCEKFPGGRPQSSIGREGEKLDLENAVLIQELSAMKEEKADLKAAVYLLERDKEGLELTLQGKIAELEAARIQLMQLRADMDAQAEEGGRVPQKPVLLSEREEEMRCRLLDMADALQSVTEHADLRQRQSEQFILDLRHANDALLAAFDRTRKKNQGRVERLQEQMRVMRARYEAQLQIARQHQAHEKHLSPSQHIPQTSLSAS